MYLIAIFATAVASLVYSLWKYAEKQFSIKHDSAQQLPGPMALPIIGKLNLYFREVHSKIHPDNFLSSESF